MTFLLFFALAAQAPGGPVVWLKFRGVRKARPEELRPKMALSVGGEYSQDLADADVVRLMRTGLFSRVEIRPVEVKGGVGVLVVVEERPVVGEIVFRNRGPVGREDLQKEVRSKSEATLDELRALEDCARIEKLYRRKLFPFAVVEYSSEPVPGSPGEVKLVFHVSPGRKAPFKRIRILGNDSIPEKILLALTTLHRTRRSMEGLERGEFDAEALDSDVREIERYCSSKGFLDAEVKLISVDLVRVDSRAYLEAVVEVKEGPLYATRGIEIEGTSALPPPREKVMKAIVSPGELAEVFPDRPSPYPLKEGEPFSFAAMHAAGSRVHYLYGSEGRYMTQVTARPRFVKEGCQVDVTFYVKEGELTRVNSVRARGQTKTQDAVIQREFRIERGDVYDIRKISKTRQNLLALRYFSSVQYRTRPAGKDLVDVIFDLEETETGMLQMGFGMSSNERWSGQLILEQTNFDWNRWPRSGGDTRYAFMGGGQKLSASFMWGEFTTRTRIRFSQPYIFGQPVAFGLDYYLLSGMAGLAYTEDREGEALSWTYRQELSPYVRKYAKIGLSLKHEDIRVFDIDDDVRDGSIICDDEGSWTLNRASVTLDYDSRNYPMRPSEGSLLYVTQEMTGGVLGGDKDVLKTSAGLDFFQPFSPRDVRYPTVFHLRLRAKLAEPWDDTTTVPVFERYRAGGIGTIRGFRYRSIGPWEWNERELETGEIIEDRRIVVGGNFAWYGTAEVSFPLSGEDLRFVTFLDWGNVWEEMARSRFDWDSQKKAAGFGLVMGPYYFPISLYWAWVMNKVEGDREERFSFNFATMF